MNAFTPEGKAYFFQSCYDCYVDKLFLMWQALSSIIIIIRDLIAKEI